jgi:carbon monoxide dehydrogenase subunit G
MLEKYESKQAQILRTPDTIYGVLSDFNNFTPLVAGRVDDWVVSPGGDECSFRVKGMAVGLRMVERVAPTLVKIEASDASPLGFTMWVQLKDASRNADGGSSDAPDTRMRLVLHAEMNMMIKMMIGSKIQPALDGMVEQIAAAFNAV